jgi:hypothetical protein
MRDSAGLIATFEVENVPIGESFTILATPEREVENIMPSMYEGAYFMNNRL